MALGFAALLAALGPAGAYGAFGEQLASFPVSIYEGRGIAVTGSTALLSAESSTALVDVNLATHERAGELASSGGPSGGFGALALDPAGKLWGAEYSLTKGEIDLIGAEGKVQEVFNATELDPEDTGVDGLAIAADGSFWVSGEGLHKGPTRVDHFKIEGEFVKEVGHFSAPFGNSGIASDGEGHLWLAEIEAESGEGGTRIREYTEAGAELRSFPFGRNANGEAVTPEGLAFDHCTFPGKLVLWGFFPNGVTSWLQAYEIGPSSNTAGCPPPPAPPPAPSPPPSSPPSTVGSPRAPGFYAGGTGGTVVAGAPTLLEYIEAGDPTGLLFTYTWNFGDGTHASGHGRISHTYRCAGLYHVTVTDIDSSGARHVHSAELAVGFPRSASKSYGGLRFSPHVRVAGRKAILWLSWSGRGRRVKARSVNWQLDQQHRRRVGIRNKALGHVRLRRNHKLTAKVLFSNRHAATIQACFYA